MEQSVTKRIAKNFSWLLAGNIASGLINFSLIVYIARVLGSANFGLVQLAQAFLLYLVIIVDSGLSIYGTREIARERAKAVGVAVNIFALRLVIAFIVFLISLLVLWVLPLSAMLRSLFMLTFMLVFYRAISTDWVFQGLERMEYVALFKLLFTISSFGLIVLLVKKPADLLFIPFSQFVAGSLIGLIFVGFLFRKQLPFKFGLIDPGRWPAAFLLAVPLGISIVFMQIYDNLDTIMLGLMDQAAVVGFYNAAYRIFYLFAGVFALWLTTVVPIACKRMADDPKKTTGFLEKYMRLTLLVIVPITIFAFLSAPLFIKMVFGQEYLPAVPALRCLIWALIPLTIGYSYGSLVLIPAGLFNGFLASVGVGALTNIIFNLLLIPSFSLVGAAIATIIAQIGAGFASYLFSRRVIKLGFIPFLIKPLVVSLLAYAVFVLFYEFMPFLDATARLLVGNVVFLLISGLLLILLEKQFIFSFIREILKR